MTARAPLLMQPVILCGGSGSRLWPLSRSGFPKQFLCLTGEETLFQQAAHRLIKARAEDIALSAPFIVSNEEHRFLVLEQLRESGIEPGAILLEPVARNTAPALTLAALAAMQAGADPILVVTPADHSIRDEAAFTRALQHAVREAARTAIVILGTCPDRPETGYGYIKTAASPGSAVAPTASLQVERFIEKPDDATARSYIAQGGYYWNAGIFVLKASVWLAALDCFRPNMAKATRNAWDERSSDGRFIRPAKDEFSAIPAESIDYSVIEHCPGSEFAIRMVPLAAGWTDLGAWDALWQVLPKDDRGNAYVGDVLTADTRNTLVHASSRLVSLVGVEGLVVIETADAVLIADRARSQEVKAIVAELEANGRPEHVLHRRVHRPWGWYDSVDQGVGFKVKRICVMPKASLSLQKHRHRAEHWIVVKGTAEITNGDKTIELSENQSTYIPFGEMHRLANPGNVPLEIIEVQSGSYLGEDDIVRFDDNYGRS